LGGGTAAIGVLGATATTATAGGIAGTTFTLRLLGLERRGLRSQQRVEQWSDKL